MLLWLFRLLVGCKHEWKVIDKTDMPSGVEQLAAVGQTLSRMSGGEGIRMFAKQSTTVLTCSNCGTMKIVRTRNLTRFD